MNLTKNPRSI